MADPYHAPRREDGGPQGPGLVAELTRHGGPYRPRPPCGGGAPAIMADLLHASGGASAMTLLEREAWLDPGGCLDLTTGYPEGLSPAWMRQYQACPAGLADVPPGRHAQVVSGYFEQLLGVTDVLLAPSCTLAFTAAAMAVIRSPGDEVIVLDTSYDGWPVLLRALGAQVVFARRAADGSPDPDSIAAAVTARTRAVVIVSPDNPLGTVCGRDVLGRLLALCAQRGITLVADHCLAEMNPFRTDIPLLPRLAGPQAAWIAVADTGKLLGLAGSKLGAIACSPGWRDAVAAASSPLWCRLGGYDLCLLASVLSDPRLGSYRLQASAQVAASYVLLADRLPAPLALARPPAGSFALIDAAGLEMTGAQYAALLREQHQVVAIPVSWFPAGHDPVGDTRIRVALARPPAAITRLAAALNQSVATLAGTQR